METFAGFRVDGSDLVVAMPLCAGDSLESADVVVDSDEGDGFETLWSAREPRTADARDGVFHVNSPHSFTTVIKQSSGALPGEFFVETRQGGEREPVTESGYVDLAQLESVELGNGEFVTYQGKVMTRAEINAQLPCNKKHKKNEQK
ncbi:hypothetical protein [Streptomyces sp. V2I9]|uniref:hypothetical protein n=1 Tax=Streptomyces sp. V2I9 TaxID=3042304 RepID=UPI0027D837E5|nr:hypothetical protein [Streptomyces sp. V2I9]